jgi:hypothetical protein
MNGVERLRLRMARVERTWDTVSHERGTPVRVSYERRFLMSEEKIAARIRMGRNGSGYSAPPSTCQVEGRKPSQRGLATEPLLSERGTHKPVMARFWPGLGQVSVRKSLQSFQMFPPRSPTGTSLVAPCTWKVDVRLQG